MIVEFYRCCYCNRIDEKRQFLKREKCVCGAVRFVLATATTLDLILFLIRHPSYLYKALRGDK